MNDKDNPKANKEEQPDLAKIIERAKNQLEHMMDLAPQLMMLVDSRGVVMRVNKALLMFGGFSAFTQVLGQKLDKVLPCDTDGFYDALLKSRGGNESRLAIVTRGDDAKREISFSHIGTGGGTDLHVIMASDVTDERALQADREKRSKLEAALATVGGLMHNINQPLTVIAVTAKLMHMEVEKGTFQPDAMKERLETIMDLTMQVAAILRQAENQTDYITEQYPGPGHREILDFQRG